MPSLVVLVVDSVVHTNEVNEGHEAIIDLTYIRQLGRTKVGDFLFVRRSEVHVVLLSCDWKHRSSSDISERIDKGHEAQDKMRGSSGESGSVKYGRRHPGGGQQ